MASYPWNIDHTETKNVYAVVTNAAGNVLDFNDNTFKALGSATTPTVALTEQTGGGGSGKSNYVYSLDLTRINKTLDTSRAWITFYERASGSAAPLTDTALNFRTPFTVQAGEWGEDALGIEFGSAFTSTAGTTVRFVVTVTRNGKPVLIDDLDAAATCTITATEAATGMDLFTTSATTVNSSGYFVVSQSTPNYSTDKVYQHTVAVACAGTTTTFNVPVPVFG